MTLNKPLVTLLNNRKEEFASKADDYTKKIYSEGIEAVINSNIDKTAKQVGDMAPEFALNNALNKSVSLKEYLAKGSVVLTWYRGGWCPYCNLTLQQLQEEVPNFTTHGANLIALTPELPDKSISTAEKNSLGFEVLSDVGNKVAREYGLVFKLTAEVAKNYKDKFNLPKYNGDDSAELPMAATYVINEQGEIVHAFLDADYRNRQEPAEITLILKNLAHK